MAAADTQAPKDDGSILDSSAAGATALRGSALRTAGYVAGVLLTVASAPLLIRHLGVADFGRYVTVISLVTLAGGVTEGGLNAVALREYAALEGEQRSRTLAHLLGIRIALTLAGIAGAVVFAVLAGYDEPLLIGTAAAGVGLLLQGLQTLLVTPLQGELRFRALTAIELARQVVTVGLIVALVVAGATLLPFLFVSLAAAALAFAITVPLVRGRIPLRPSFDRRAWGPLLHDTFPYAVAVALNIAYFRIAIIAMSVMSSDQQTGYFATSFRVIEVLIAVPALLVGAAFPILARAVGREDTRRFDYAVGRLIELSFVVGVWVVLCLELAAPTIIRILGGPQAEPAVEVLRIQSVAILATFVAIAAAYPLLSLKRYRAALAANAAALGASLVLTLALVPTLEADGAAIAAVAAEITLAVASVALLARERRAALTGLRGAPAIVAAAVLGGLVVLLPGLPPLIDAALASLVFAAALKVLGRFPPEARELLGR
jgi:O-antigen/teichoic acid export membrane protein